MLPQSLRDSQRVFEGVRFDVHAFDVSGHRREVIVHPGATVILPLMDDGSVVMIRNERFAVGETLWELPAGTLEIGEDPAVCAAREVTEETGYEADSLELLTAFYATPGICTEKLHAYVARGLTHVGQDLDATEKIEVEVMAWDRTMQMVRSGEICDAKTIATLLYFNAFMKDAC